MLIFKTDHDEVINIGPDIQLRFEVKSRKIHVFVEAPKGLDVKHYPCGKLGIAEEDVCPWCFGWGRIRSTEGNSNRCLRCRGTGIRPTGEALAAVSSAPSLKAKV